MKRKGSIGKRAYVRSKTNSLAVGNVPNNGARERHLARQWRENPMNWSDRALLASAAAEARRWQNEIGNYEAARAIRA